MVNINLGFIEIVLAVVQASLIVFKIVGTWNVSWWIVFIPTYILIILILISIAIIGGIVLFAWLLK